MAMGYFRRGLWLYWNYPLERYYLALFKARRIFNKIRWITVLVIGLNFWLWAAYFAYRRLPSTGAGVDLLFNLPTATKVLIWLGIICFCYIWYRSIRERQHFGMVERYDYKKSAGETPPEAKTWAEVKKLARRQTMAINKAFTDEALAVIGAAYALADKAGEEKVTPFHLFNALLSSNRIANIFIRLGISAQVIQKQLEPLLTSGKSAPTGPLRGVAPPTVAAEVRQIIFYAYEEAHASHQEYVSITELLVATIASSAKLQEILYDLTVDRQKLTNVVEWARIRERLHRQYLKFRSAARHRSKHGMDKAMTAVATPFLNQFSDDLTLLAQFGHTEPCVAREKEIEEIFQIVDGGQQNVILVGDYGVGKKSIVEGVALRMVEDDVPERLKDKRLVRLSISELLSGATPSEAVDRLINIMQEIARAKNIILLIHNVQELVGISVGSSSKSLDVADTLADYLGSGHFITIATTTSEAFAQHIVNSKLGTLFGKVVVEEMDQNQAIQVLESKVGAVEYKQQVFFAYEAIEKAVDLAKHYLRDVALPGSALQIMNEAASFTRAKKGVNSLVTSEEVATVVAAKTKIPVTTVSADETTKLLHLEEAMHQRLIGQDEAVNVVANALRRARAKIRSTTRPIANFLFLGPTGVGKTELAKTIAEVYFGGEERMIRLDMSEYQDKASIYRLIGSPGEKGSGILTEAVRRSPFALVLLDEIEKADKDILNLFLQVMDDGRLSDSTGRVADFTNVILIATSNAGTSFVQGEIKAGKTTDIIKSELLHGELKEYFRPEFLNRFDGIVLFRPLDHAAIKQIASLMLKHIAKELEAKGIELAVKDEALEFFASVGFDPEFGARPLRRVLQERVENQLADLVLKGGLKRRDVIEIGAEGKITVINV